MRGYAVRLALGAACLLVSAAGCTREEPPRVAFVGSYRAAQGALLAAHAVSQHGGIRGHPLELSIRYDNGGSGARAIASAESLAADPAVLAVVGHASSTTSLAAAQTYNSAGLPQLAPTTSAPVYALAGPYSFRLMPSDESQAAFLARQVPSGARVGLAYLNADYGRGLRRALERALKQHGVEPVFEWGFNAPLDTVQTEVILSEVTNGAPRQLFWIGPPRALAAVLPEIRRRQPDLEVYASEASDADETYSTLHAQLVGVRFVRFLDPATPGQALQDLRSRYRAVTNMELTYDVVFSYDAVELLGEAMRGGARTREDIRRYLVSLGRTRPPYRGIGGPIAFDSSRTALRPYHLAEVTPAGVRALP